MSELRYVDLPDLERIRSAQADPVERAAAFADACRLNVLYEIARAGSGHIGTSFSCIDILAWLHLEVLRPEDRYFSSKGHDAPALYAVLAGVGRLPFEQLHALRRLGGLPGHPDVVVNPEVVTSTGSLGMGISKAKGFVLADRLAGRSGDVYVLTGDGELQEGQFWESLGGAANRGLGEITAIVDRNKVQSDTWVEDVSDLGPLARKVEAFGWAVETCDGNDVGAFASTLAGLRERAPDRPKLIVADTEKGAGVSFMVPGDMPHGGDELYGYHSGAPSADDYEAAVAELSARLDSRVASLGLEPIELVTAERRQAAAPERPQRLIAAYSEALAEIGEQHPQVVALDADLVLDTGLIPFRKRFPERFFECGIAEQDMVSQAGAMALSGLTPIAHSFGCFLAPRPNEQIHNNATEETKVIYVGSLVGIVPGGPGHSHQSVRDISALGAMPGMSLLEPATDDEVGTVLRWAVEEAPGPVYIRLVSVPWDLGFEAPAPVGELVPGRGRAVREGSNGTFVTTGPVMLSQAYAAAERLDFTVVSLPWLRGVDGDWLAELAGDGPVVTVDNHYVDGGQGDAVLRALADVGAPNRVLRLGVDRVPYGGTNDEVLRAHELDADGLVGQVEAALAPAP